jgi:cobyrinic acid a,c-diamide synthase
MMDFDHNLEIFQRYSHEADVVIVEGVMGLFDGLSGVSEEGSTAQMAKWLRLPVLLVIDARSMARSIAALALGFTHFDPDLNVMGLLVNRVGSDKHRHMLSQALQETLQIPIYGYLPREKKLEIPSRHLGLMTAEVFDRDHQALHTVVDWMESHVQVENILKDCHLRRNTIRFLNGDQARNLHNNISRVAKTRIRIGIARDEAFCFYYAENLRLLEEAGAELVPFSPLNDKHLPHNIHALYFGGGYPELYCQTLSQNLSLVSEVYAFGMIKKAIYGECGGFMYLSEAIIDLNTTRHPMVCLLPVVTRMDSRLRSLGYRQVITQKKSILGPEGTAIKGHEFHYSHLEEGSDRVESIYQLKDRSGHHDQAEGFLNNYVLGSYVHLHFGSNPDIAHNMIWFCQNIS